MQIFTAQKVNELIHMGEDKAADKLSLEEIEVLIKTAANSRIKIYFEGVKLKKRAILKKVRERLARLESELSISFEATSHNGFDGFEF